MICTLCPRMCGALRDETHGEGYCGAPESPRLARAALHMWEEPCISGTRGSGTIFFSGCSLGCLYCQNYAVSHENFGKTVSLDRLFAIMQELADKGAHNINLVTPTHYAHLVPELAKHKPQGLPIVYNTSGYERVETLRTLKGSVDIYLTDLKYFSSRLSEKLSDAPDYFSVARRAIEEMYAQTGPAVFDDDGMLVRGVIVRHMTLPGYSADSLKVLRYCADALPDGILYSIMSQYTPCGPAAKMPPLDRRLNATEYLRISHFVRMQDFTGYMQELSSAKEEYIPPFDLSGV